MTANQTISIIGTVTTSSLLEGYYSTQINVNSNGGDCSFMVMVNIIGIPQLEITPTPFNFEIDEITFPEGVNTITETRIFHINNIGTGALTGSVQLYEQIDDFNLIECSLLPDASFNLTTNQDKEFTIELNIQRPTNGLPNYELSIMVNSNSGDETGNLTIAQITGIEENLHATGDIPKEFSLGNNYPNPFNPNTTIIFGIPNQANISLIIYNNIGEIVKTLIDNKTMSSGTYQYNFNATNISSGIYYYRLIAIGEKNFIETKKMILLK